MRCAVIGAGAWGTALANLLADNGHETTLWAYEPEVAEEINTRRSNTQFLPGTELHSSLRATTDHRDAFRNAELLVFATPSHHLRAIAKQGRAHAADDGMLIVASKGIERGTLA